MNNGGVVTISTKVGEGCVIQTARYEPLGALPRDAWNIAASLSGIRVNDPVVRYHPASGAIGVFPSSDGTYSWCRNVSEGVDTAVVLPGCRLIDTAWSHDWLHLINRGLLTEGKLVLPYRGDGLASEPAGLTPLRLNDLFGSPIVAKHGFAVFKADSTLRPLRSISGHFMVQTSSWIGKLIEYRAAELRNDLTICDWRANYPRWVIDSSSGLEQLTADFLTETFADLARFLVFSVQGTNSKSYSLQKVFQDLLGPEETIRWADLGSGSGFLGIELAATLPVHVINVDKSLAQSRVGLDMLRCFPDREESCTFITSRLESVELPNELDAVSMLTSLCYVPRHAQQSLLRNSWNSLRPGGALLVLENIRNKAYARDYDLMFDEEELEALLNALGGEIRYYHALTGKRIPREAARGKTCYRVRIKT